MGVELGERVGAVEWEVGQARAARRMCGECRVDAVECADEHFVRVVLAGLRELRGRRVHPHGVEERRRSVRALVAVWRVQLGKELVELACEALAADRAERRVVAVAQKVCAEEWVVCECLQDDVEEACRAHVAQATRHARDRLEAPAVRDRVVLHELVRGALAVLRDDGAARLALEYALEARVVHDVVASAAEHAAVHDICGEKVRGAGEVRAHV